MTDLGLLLEKEINRFKEINNYNKKVNEVSYRFYNEEEEEGAEDEIIEPEAPGMGGEPDMDMGMEEPDMGDMDMGMEEPDMGMEEPDMGMEEPEDDVVELDITELIDSTNSIRKDINYLNDGINRLQNIISKVSSIEDKLQNMDNIITSLDSLTKEVMLMRPPTESERRKALSQKSYPFNTSLEDYNNGSEFKTQTDLERRNHKMNMHNTIMGDYDEKKVSDSFY